MSQCHVCGTRVTESTRFLKLSNNSFLTMKFCGNFFALNDEERILMEAIIGAMQTYETNSQAAAEPQVPAEEVR